MPTPRTMPAEAATGTPPGLAIVASANDGLHATIDGRRVRLAVVDDDGRVLAAGDGVADAVERSAVGAYRALLQARGHLVVVEAV